MSLPGLVVGVIVGFLLPQVPGAVSRIVDRAILAYERWEGRDHPSYTFELVTAAHDLIEESDRLFLEDMAIAKTSQRLWARAVVFLRDDLAHDAEEIRKSIAAGGEFGWAAPYHFNWGMGVRNKLRDAGFGEKEFGVANLDNIYVKLVEEAVKEPA